jgi:hypothetical protein
MKILMLCFLLPIFFNNNVQPRKIIFLIDQGGGGRPIANTIDVFWQDQADFDTITVTGDRILTRLEKEFKGLKESEMKFSVHAAAIRHWKNGRRDTLYTDRFFHFWRINGKSYEDTSEFFERTLANFFIED